MSLGVSRKICVFAFRGLAMASIPAQLSQWLQPIARISYSARSHAAMEFDLADEIALQILCQCLRPQLLCETKIDQFSNLLGAQFVCQSDTDF